MTVSIDQTSWDAMRDTLNTEIGANHELRLYDNTDTLLATLTYSGSGTATITAGTESITFSEASYTDDLTPANGGTVDYATIHRTAATPREVVRFTDPSTELSLSSTTIATNEPVRVTVDVVVKMLAYTVP